MVPSNSASSARRYSSSLLRADLAARLPLTVLDRALAGGADRRHELRVVFHSSCHESIRLLDIDAVTEPGSDCSDIERDRALSRRCGGFVRHESTLPFQRSRWA